MFKPKARLVVTAVLLSAIIISGIVVNNFLKQIYVIPVVTYHSVVPDPDPDDLLSVSVKAFEKQMRFLKQHRYNVVPLEMVVQLISENSKVPAKTIAITFDDGYLNNYTYAFPILKKYNLPATIFLIVDEINNNPKFLSWKEIKIMQDSGLIIFGSHTLTHAWLPDITEAEAKNEIFVSKSILEAKLGRKVVALGYPGGRFNARVRKLVIDAGYRLAVATNPGNNYPDNDIFALKRLRIKENSSNMFIFAAEISGFYGFTQGRKKHYAEVGNGASR